MLIISRKLNESIVIGDDIVVMVVQIRGEKVRLGIQTPHGMTVHRREVYDAVRRAETSAGDTGPGNSS